jgi:DNA modification methylase
MRANSSSSLKRPKLKPSASSSTSGRARLCEEQVVGVVLRPLSELEPYTLNARAHPRSQLEKLAASIREFGFLIPILVDREGRIIAGHARAEAARLLGLAKVPTIAIHHLSDAQVRAFRIADNRLAELAEWDEQALAIELKALSELELSFDVEITGFELAEIDILIERAEPGGELDEADEIPELDEATPPVSQVGDLWLLAEHRLLCADALRPESYARLLDGETAQMVFTDPPYNVPINGHVGGAGKIKHAEFVMASGEMSEGEFTTFLTTVLCNLANRSADGALIYSCMDWRHGYELETAGRKAGLKLLNLCVWNKDNGGMGSFYRSKHELVFVFKHGSAPHINNIELGQYGRYRTNIWDYAGANTLRHGRLEELAMHPTVKPVALVADAIKDCTGRGHIVLDAFAGSGTTLIAAQKTGRVGCALELDPRYVDVAIKRWDRLNPKKAVHAETGLSFDELAATRRAPMEARCKKPARARAAHGGSDRGR